MDGLQTASRRLSRCLLCVGLLCVGLLCVGLLCASSVRADEPARYLLSSTGGAALRITRNEDFDQNAIAPVFADVLVGYVPESTRGYRHGVGLGASLNLTEEGGYTEPVGIGQQLALMPAYLVVRDLDADFSVLGHFGVPLAFIGATSVGLELGAGAGYRLLAGLSAYGELSVDLYLGERAMVHPTLAAEIGVMLDYEVLP